MQFSPLSDRNLVARLRTVAVSVLVGAITACSGGDSGGGGDGGAGPTGPTQITAAAGNVVVAATGEGAGRVSGGGVSCVATAGETDGTCTIHLDEPGIVELTATAAPGSAFDGWSGACSGTTATCRMPGGKSVTASFSSTPGKVTLRIATAGEGAGAVSVSPGDAVCTRGSTGAESGTCTLAVDQNTGISLTASAATGSSFRGWMGACEGTTATCTRQLTQAAAVVAEFGLLGPDQVLTITGAGTGVGHVTSEPAGIDCRIESGGPTGACSQGFPQGTRITLSARPASGAQFETFTGACTATEPTCELILDQPRAVEVGFGVSEGYVPVSVTVEPSTTGAGAVTSDPAGIDCTLSHGARSGECVMLASIGTEIVLTAVSEEGSVFLGWEGGCPSPTSSSCTITVPATPLTLTTNWATQSGGNKTLTITGSGRAHIYDEARAVSCQLQQAPDAPTGRCSVSFPEGTSVDLTVEALDGYTFEGWGGACSGTGAQCTVVMNQDRTVSASLQPPPVGNATVDISAIVGSRPGIITSDPSGISCSISADGVSGTCTAVFTEGTPVTLMAAPTHPDDMLLAWGWSTKCPPGAPTCSLVAEGNIYLALEFRQTAVLRIAPDTFPFDGSGIVRTYLPGTNVQTPSSYYGLECPITSQQSEACELRVPLGIEVGLGNEVDPGTIEGDLIGVYCRPPAYNSDVENCTLNVSKDTTVLGRFSSTPQAHIRMWIPDNLESSDYASPVIECQPHCGRVDVHTPDRTYFVPLSPSSDSVRLVFTIDMDTSYYLPLRHVLAGDCEEVPGEIMSCAKNFAGRAYNISPAIGTRDSLTMVVIEPAPGTSISMFTDDHVANCAPYDPMGPYQGCVVGILPIEPITLIQEGGVAPWWHPPCNVVAYPEYPEPLCHIYSHAGVEVPGAVGPVIHVRNVGSAP